MVVVRGCRASAAIIPGPEWGEDKFDWFSRGFNFSENNTEEKGYLFHRVHEWRLNMITGLVHEKFLTGTHLSMDFPVINGYFTGLKHNYGYTQLIDSMASSVSGITKYGGMAKLYFEEKCSELSQKIYEGPIKEEYHKLLENTFCTGIAFVHKPAGVEEDDGWIITYVHNEINNLSQAYIIDAKKFESEPVAIITLPKRVPYGHHSTFVVMPYQA